MTPVSSLRLILACVFGLLFPALANAATPKWKLTVPSSSLGGTDSALNGITSSAAGDAFVVINHSITIDIGGIPFPTPVGSQLLLLNPSGKIVGAGEFAGVGVFNVLYVSAKRVLVSTGLGITEFAVGPGGTLVSKPVPLETLTEVPLVPIVPAGSKFLHTTTVSSGFVTEIRRYLFSKLKP